MKLLFTLFSIMLSTATLWAESLNLRIGFCGVETVSVHLNDCVNYPHQGNRSNVQLTRVCTGIWTKECHENAERIEAKITVRKETYEDKMPYKSMNFNYQASVHLGTNPISEVQWVNFSHPSPEFRFGSQFGQPALSLQFISRS